MTKMQKIRMFISMSVVLLIFPNLLYGEKIYEVHPDGVGIHSLEGVRKIIKQNHSSMNEDIIVLMKDGFYTLSSTLFFDVEDGGTDKFSITYKAESNAKPIISGGHIIEDWVIGLKDYNILTALVGNSSHVRNLYIDERRVLRSHGEKIFAEEIYCNSNKGIYGLVFDNNDIPCFESVDGLELSYKHHWRQYYFIIDSIVGCETIDNIPKGKSLVVIKNFNLALDLYPGIGAGYDNPYNFENAIELMDEDEFYFQPSSHSLHYRNSGERPKNFLIGDLDCIVRVKSSNIEDRVKNLYFEGISFCYNSYSYPSIGGFIPLQGSHLITPYPQTYTMIPGAIQIEDAENVHFSFCSFMHLGSNGISIINNTDGIVIDHNKFIDISGSAISLSDYRHVSYDDNNQPIVNTYISNNLIKDTGVEFASCCGIEAFYIENLTIANNELYNSPYTGISVGFGWSIEPTTTQSVKILNNKIVGDTQKCFDGGAIYSLSHFGGEGLLIEGNYINEISDKPCKDSQGAIYTDEGSSNVIIKNNVVMTERKWFFFHQAGKVEVDSIYVLPNNHQAYGGINASSGRWATEIKYIGNGEHIFDLPCEKSNDIIKNAGIKKCGDEGVSGIGGGNGSEENFFQIRKTVKGFTIVPLLYCGKFSVWVYGIDGQLKGFWESKASIPIIMEKDIKGFHIIKVSSESYNQVFRVVL